MIKNKKMMGLCLILQSFLLFVVMCFSAMAAGTITDSGEQYIGGGKYYIDITCTADESDASFPTDQWTSINIDGYITMVEWHMGTTALSNDCGFKLFSAFDADLDVCGDIFEDLDTNTEGQNVPLIGDLNAWRVVKGKLNPQIQGTNSVNSAVIVIRVWYQR